MTVQGDNPDKRTDAAELAAIQRNSVTIPADKLAELQRKAKLVDELLEVLEGASEVIDYIDEWNVPIRLSTRIKEVIAKTKGEL